MEEPGFLDRLTLAGHRSPAKLLARWIIPYNLYSILHRRFAQSHEERQLRREVEHLQNEWRSANQAQFPSEACDITREQIMELLTGWGLDCQQVDAGSMPTRDLEAIFSFLRDYSSPMVGIHVGNFVGVSLAWLAVRLKHMSEDNVIVSIDPNLTHRGIDNTEEIVTRLLRTLSVQDVVIRVTGYSLSKSVSNDGRKYGTDYDPLEHFPTEDSPEWQLKNLLKILAGRVDFVMLDGNHHPDYLREEVRISHKLLCKGGIIFVDDITEGNPFGLTYVFDELSSEQVFCSQHIGNRIGVLIKKG